MKASETNLQEMIEGTKQYVIPMFQRTYSWEQKQWQALWEDIMELVSEEDYENHFIGSIVSIPVNANPHGVQQFLVIDGQQRLTTMLIFLSALRDVTANIEHDELSNEIHDTMLINRYKKGEEFFKLLPTQVDKEVFKKIINNENLDNDLESNIVKAYIFFKKKISDTTIDIENLKANVLYNLSIVSIVLSTDDNPYLVFESLNAKGQPLTEADLIRNYLFMRISANEQEEMYKRYWLPMQESLNGNLTDFIRHFLIGININVKKKDVYVRLKQQADSANVIDYLKMLSTFAGYYEKLLNPIKESNPKIRRFLERVVKLEATTAFPFLLYIFRDYHEKKYTDDQMSDILSIIDNFLVRRYVCNIESKPLNKMFGALYNQISLYNSEDSIAELKSFLQVRGYPKDQEVRNNLLNFELYGSGDKREKCKFILTVIEDSYGHKEKVELTGSTIEHIMPQTLTDWWRQELGENAEEIQGKLLHTIGNLTLSGYNSELSNESFPIKKKYYGNSNIQLNKDILEYEKWNEASIIKRSELLIKDFINVWPYFGSETIKKDDVTGSSPRLLTIYDFQKRVKTWREVMENTIMYIYNERPVEYEKNITNYSGVLAITNEKMRSPKQLANGHFIEQNLSSKSIYNFCKRVFEDAGFDRNEWNVEIEVRG